MRTVEQYRHIAERCRKLGHQATPPDWRGVLESIAQTWEKLANLREGDLKAAQDDDHLR